ncbi:MAG: hypothetical protein WCG03_08155 [Kiritimatiellales bacterium]
MTGCLIGFLILLSGPCEAASRGYDLVEKFHLTKNPDSTDASSHVTPWCVATLWLGTNNIHVTPTDIGKANQRLDDFDNPAMFSQISEDARYGDQCYLSLYWALPDILKVVLDTPVAGRTTLDARVSARNVLKNFVAYRDNYTDAALSDEKLYQISGSMNHDWLRKSTFLLTAQHFKNLNDGTGWNIYADGYTAAQHYDAWRAHIKERIKKLAARGMDPEISPGYISVTLEALFNLRDLSEDPEISSQADKFISLYLGDYAIDSFHGIRGGGLTRVYKDSWAYNPDVHYMPGFTHLFANDPATFPKASPDRTYLGAAMSGYSCPSVVSNLMTQTKGSYAHTSRRPARGTHIIKDGDPWYTLKWPADMRRFTYCTSNYVLGGFSINDQASSTNYTLLISQNQWMGLVTSCSIYSRVYFQCGSPTNTVSGYRELTAIGSKGGMLIKRQKMVPGTPDLFCWMSDDFRTYRVGPDSTTDYWIFSKNMDGSVYVAVKAIEATSAGFYSLTTDGPGYGDPLKIDFSDDNTICALEAAKASDYASFSAFQAAIKASTFSKSGTEVTYSTLAGDVLKMYTDGAMPTLNGANFGLNISVTYSGNYLYNSTYDSPVITLEDPSGNTLSLDFNY